MTWASGVDKVSSVFNKAAIVGKEALDSFNSISNPHAINITAGIIGLIAFGLFLAANEKHKWVSSRMPGGRDSITRNVAIFAVSMAAAVGLFIVANDIYGDSKGQTPSWESKDKPIVNPNGSTVSKSCTVTLPGLPPPPPPAKPC